MSGLDTLMHEGLEITQVDTWQPIGDGSTLGTAELLEWHCVAGGDMPDSDMTVLLWLRYEDGTADWCSGWWDGERWLDCASGGVVSGAVTHWAEPGGPAA